MYSTSTIERAEPAGALAPLGQAGQSWRSMALGALGTFVTRIDALAGSGNGEALATLAGTPVRCGGILPVPQHGAVGLAAQYIREDGAAERTASFEGRLLTATGVAAADLPLARRSHRRRLPPPRRAHGPWATARQCSR
jgi:hypothetical protein